jgi:hypothetical protein
MTPEQANDPEAPPAPTAKPLVGVLAGLPRTRPQRTSARREAARARAKSETASPASAGKQGEARAAAKAKPKTRASAKRASAKPKTRASAKPKMTPKAKPKATIAKKPVERAPKLRAPAKTEEHAPKQGYEPEEEVELGNTVHPPSRGELIESLADIFGELAGLGANAGGRLLKDALSVFRRP